MSGPRRPRPDAAAEAGSGAGRTVREEGDPARAAEQAAGHEPGPGPEPGPGHEPGPGPEQAAGHGPGAGPGRTVRIDYRRLPDRVRVFRQRVVLERADVIVTLSEPVRLERPMRIGGRIAMQNDSRALWFTFPGQWHDIGRFHLADGTFTGFYANILTPPRIDGDAWDTTDLFLDVWLPRGADARILDEDELEEALADGTIEPALAARAREEAERLLRLAEAGAWPPPVVHEWPLERALATLAAEEAAARRE